MDATYLSEVDLGTQRSWMCEGGVHLCDGDPITINENAKQLPLPACLTFYTSAPPTHRRNCIGTFFAMQEAILMLATILQSYRLAPTDDRFPEAKPLITLRPSTVPLRLTRKERTSKT